ncbi:MAG: DUF177 domain-containing protein [Pyrinomonadaceae bacterium]|nr:DUF177 domain-containing protein [Pyrinomonadaceae bacterium]
MKIDLERLGHGSTTFEITVPESDLSPEPGIHFPNGASAKGTVASGSAGVTVSGEIAARPLIDCTRCLEPVEKELSFQFDAVFVRPEDFTADKEREVHGEDLNVDILEGEQIDLYSIVREQLLLEMPEQVFCKEDCKGLCDRCGTNLNTDECRCKDDDIDPRWAALKNLK